MTDDRLIYINTLVGAARIAKAAGDTESMNRLTTLAEAIHDLDNNRVAPFLAPTKKGGNPPDGHKMWRKRVLVLLALTALKKSGIETLKEGAQHIATKYPNLNLLMTRGTDLTDAILRWRRDLEEATKSSNLAEFANLLMDGEREMEALTPPDNQSSWQDWADNLCARIDAP